MEKIASYAVLRNITFLLKNHLIGEPSVEVGGQPKPKNFFLTPSLYCASVLLKKQQLNKMPTFVSVSEEILDDRNGCNTQKNPLEINKKIKM